MQLVVVIPAGWPAPKDFSNPTNFADYIEDMLEALSSPVNYINNKTIVGIELGAEEDFNKWTKDANGDASETGGSEFAAYYLAAWDKIRNTANHPEWKQLRIISGGSPYDWKQIAAYNPPSYYGGPSYKFLKGFLNTVTSSQNIAKIPDMIGIHTYTEKHPPEGHRPDSWKDIKKLFDVLFSMCKDSGFIPNFCTTEYGFGATLPPLNMVNKAVPSATADNYTQSIYYLRSRIITGCIQPVGLEYSIYWLHPRMVGDSVIDTSETPWGICDWGFHNFDGYPGTNRAARYIAREIMDASNALNLGSSDVYTWFPLETNLIDSPNYIYLAKCGFKSSQTVYWLAIWRFQRYTVNDDAPFYAPSGTSMTITIPGNFYSNYTVSSWKFAITQTNQNNVTILGKSLPNKTGTAAFGPSGSVTNVSYSSGLTSLTVSPVNENPLFIKFVKN